MIKSMTYIIKKMFAHEKEVVPETHEVCSECKGSGFEDMVFDCQHCEGSGYVKKPYLKYIETLPPLDN